MKRITLFIALSIISTIGFSQPFNRFLSLDGTDDYLEDNFSGTNFPSGNFTLEFWIYSCEHKGYSLIDAAGSTAGGGIEVRYSHNNGGLVTVVMRRSGITFPTTSISTPLGTNNWNHYALTYNATDSMAHTFVNGVPTDTVKVAAYIGASARFYVGRLDYTSSGFLKAQVDEMRISDTIRYGGVFTTQTSEFAVDNRTKALYHFNDMTTNILDASPNNYHLIGRTPQSIPVLISNDTSGVISSISAGTTSLCSGDSTTLLISQSSQLFDNDKWVWYANSCSGISIGEGDSLVVKPTVSTTYFARAEGGCAPDGLCNLITITVNQLPQVTLAAFNSSSVCEASSVIVLPAGSPAGGVYSGAGVVANTFDPSIAGVGTHQITYTYTTASNCVDSDTKSISVSALPQVTLAAFNSSSVCEGSSAIALPSGSPVGGVYSGAGVVGNTFDPTIAGVGTHQITYTFTNANNCANSDTKSISVSALPQVTLAAFNSSSVCEGSSAIALPSGSPVGGVYSGAGVVGNTFDPTIAGVGTHQITYTFTNANNCADSDTKSISVSALPQVTLAAFNSSSVCEGSSAIALPSGSPLGGVYSGAGVVGSTFDPTIAGVGTHQITYTFTNANNCVDSDTKSISVTALPQVTLAGFAADTVCLNAGAIALPVGSPAGGVYSGAGVVGNNFDPIIAGVGTHQITYTYVDSSNCIGEDSSAVTVNLCVGLNSYSTASNFSVFPNPFKDYIVIRNPSNEKIIVQLVDMNGKVLATQFSIGYEDRISTDGLPKGIYIITIQGSNSIFNQKLIKL